MNFDKNEIIVALSLKFEGDWQKILSAISNRDLDINEDDIKKVRSLSCGYITILDDKYPTFLKEINQPPFALFYYGDISLINNFGKNLAVVGSRECSSYGDQITREIVSRLDNDIVIVSGLAKGIDAIAHEAAIKSGKKTVAILGSGIENCYPKVNFPLYQKIKKEHLLISEYPLDATPDTIHFPFRDRLISAFSKYVLVTEAKKRSGTMITVGFALSEGKDVMCVPARANEDSGCNHLISEGAFLVENSEEVMEIIKQ